MTVIILLLYVVGVVVDKSYIIPLSQKSEVSLLSLVSVKSKLAILEVILDGWRAGKLPLKLIVHPYRVPNDTGAGCTLWQGICDAKDIEVCIVVECLYATWRLWSALLPLDIRMSDAASCCWLLDLSYTRSASRDLWPVHSWITFSGTPLVHMSC